MGENAIVTGYNTAAEDADGDTLTFSLSGGLDQALFNIDPVSGILSFNTAPDFENPVDSNADNEYFVSIRVDDGRGGSANIIVSVTVANLNESPRFSSGSIVFVVENSVATGYSATAEDVDGDNLLFRISGGADQALFSINPETGVLNFIDLPDFENPADSDADSVYQLELSVDDGNGASDSLNITVTVTDGNDPPRFISPGSIAVPENSIDTGYIASAEDENGDPITFGLSGGADQALFKIDPFSGMLSFNKGRDFEHPADADMNNEYMVQISANDGNGGTAIHDVVVSITNVDRQLVVQVSYPTPNADFGGNVSQTTVTGNIVDLEGGVVGLDDVDWINVNGFSATQFLDNPGRWSVNIPVASPEHTINVLAQWSDGLTENVSFNVNNRILITDPESIDIDVGENRAIVVDKNMDALISIDLATGDNSIISGVGAGIGPDLRNPRSVVLHADTGSALVVDDGLIGLLSIDLASGDRTVISSNDGFGVGPGFRSPGFVALNSSNSGVFVMNRATLALISVDLATGNRALVSDSETGGGPEFYPWGMAQEIYGGQVLITDLFLNALLAIDISSGDRRIVSNNTIGIGPLFVTPKMLALDRDQNRAFIADTDRLVTVNLMTGDRSILSDSSRGSGQSFRYMKGVAFEPSTNQLLVGEAYENRITSVDTVTGDRTVLTSPVNVGAGPKLEYSQAITVDIANNRVLAVDHALDAVVAVDLASGNRAILSDATIGSGPDFRQLWSLALDAANNRALVVDGQWESNLYWVNLLTGDRTVLSNSNVGQGPILETPDSVAIDFLNNRALVIDLEPMALFAADLDSGDRTILSDSYTGEGPDLDYPRSLVLGKEPNQALVLLHDTLMAVDLTNGNRTIISGPELGSGPYLSSAQSLMLDAANNRALILMHGVNGLWRSLIAVDLSTGDRTVLSDDSTGTGIDFQYVVAAALDTANNRVFVSDNDRSLGGLFVVELGTGERAVMTK
jgi:hypothetical protein